MPRSEFFENSPAVATTTKSNIYIYAVWLYVEAFEALFEHYRFVIVVVWFQSELLNLSHKNTIFLGRIGGKWF
jgi:hypothetical protein